METTSHCTLSKYERNYIRLNFMLMDMYQYNTNTCGASRVCFNVNKIDTMKKTLKNHHNLYPRTLLDINEQSFSWY